ncbi:hypothetical protein DdX_18745 [Ditylenchus destructor]|uniref:Uncharacterized protein n=1 Tax=Ditylenchus destructor TaxID=166010 RepID=A0AAD4MJM3_9BILA|nr:hypothetical protein DdX_18745 [Ditylenchus destructor]
MSLYGTSNKSFAQSPTLTEIFSHPNPGVCPALLCLTGRHWRSRASLKDPLRGRHSAGAACGSLNISKGNFSKTFLPYQFSLSASLHLPLQHLSQCPRMHGKKTSASKNSKDSSDEGGKPPGAKPVKHYIQTTFIFRDLSDDDRTFSHICMEKLHNLRPRLKSHAQVTIDNENIDCSVHHFAQCREYPLKTSYHFLVVEDSVHGAAVYSLDRKHNTNSNAVEMAILDALSRHSLHPLVGYASKEATNEVGFVREVRPAELEKFAEENMKDLRERSKSSPSTIFTYSPYELRLLNQRILELRRHDFDTQSVQSLKQFRGGELLEAIDSGKMVLVLFWTNAQSVSSHAFELWARVADAWRQKYEARNDPELILGSVACQDQTDVCTAFAISHQNQHTIYAYNDGKLIASQVYMGEESFYLQWLDIIVNTKALKALENAEELAKAKAGLFRVTVVRVSSQVEKKGRTRPANQRARDARKKKRETRTTQRARQLSWLTRTRLSLLLSCVPRSLIGWSCAPLLFHLTRNSNYGDSEQP